MQTKLAKNLDNIFKYLIFFLISFIWCNYYKQSLAVCLIASIIVASILSFVTSKIFYAKQNKKTIAIQEQKEINNIATQLMFYSKPEQIDYFFNVLSFSNTNLKKTKNHIVLHETIIIPLFSFCLEVSNYLKVANKYKNNDVIILTNKLSNELENLLNTIEESNVKVLTINDVYFKIIKPTQILPKQIVKLKSAKKLKAKELVYVAFNKKNAKSYFFSGLLLLFLSLIYKFSLYYKITGTILLLFSLFSYFNTRFNSANNNDVLNTKKNTE